MTIVVVIAAVLALAATLRRLRRTAVALLVVALALGAGPAVLAGLDELEDLGARLPVAGNDRSDATSPRAVDGDTFDVAQGGGCGQVTVRVALIDAGEASSTRYGHPTCGGQQATRFARRWAARHRSVQLRPVAGLPREDRYDRRLARMTDRGGRDYGVAIARRGWARVAVYEPPRGPGAAYLARLRRAEAAARGARRGGWGRCGWAQQRGVE